MMANLRFRISDIRVQVAAVTGLLALLALILPAPLTSAAPQERHIQVSARMFAFEPGLLRVNRGDTVVLTVESEDVVHGLYVDGYDVNAQVEPGQSAQVRFVADLPGKWKFRCSVSCGNLHPFMIGELVVEPNWPFWRTVAASLIAVVGATFAFWKS
jgi:heme/copper-type cytochrome/quinol oxidase subunit 2